MKFDELRFDGIDVVGFASDVYMAIQQEVMDIQNGDELSWFYQQLIIRIENKRWLNFHTLETRLPEDWTRNNRELVLEYIEAVIATGTPLLRHFAKYSREIYGPDYANLRDSKICSDGIFMFAVCSQLDPDEILRSMRSLVGQ